MARWFELFICGIILWSFCLCSAWDARNIFDSKCFGDINGFLRLPQIPRQDPLLVSILRDATLINRNLFSWNSYAIVASSFPLYMIGRIVDKQFHDVFYDEHAHRNLNQLPDWCVDYADGLIFAPLAILGSLTFFAKDPELRLTSRVFLEGMPFVWAAKDIVKSFETDVHIRPKNAHFAKNKRVYGGFPSGHMAASMYMTMLFGLRRGHRYAIPLGMASLVTGAILVSCNRHFFSQLVAGAALGAMYAFAANSVISYNLNRDIECGMSLDQAGNPALTISCAF